MRARPSFAAVSAAALLVSMSARARATEGLPAPTSPPADCEPGWRQLALGMTIGAAGFGLLAALGLKIYQQEKIRQFNDYWAPAASSGGGPNGGWCVVGTPGSGPPGCAEMLADSERAQRWSRVGFITASTFALAALVLKLTASETPAGSPQDPYLSSPPSFTCAPGVGLHAACRFSF
jgi:hypothetical protein